MTLSDADAAEIDILMKEYPSLREEILFHFKEAKLPAKYLQIFVAGAIVIIYYVMFGISDEAFKKAPLLTRTQMLMWILPVINFISFYFAFDIVDSYYCIFLAAGRLRKTEERINQLLHRPILVVEAFQAKHEIINGISRMCISVVQMLIVLLLSLVLPLLAYLGYLWPQATTSAQKAALIFESALSVGMSALFIYTCYRVFRKERDRIYAVLTRTVADLGKELLVAEPQHPVEP
jgi:hypothetical protein